MTRRTSTIVVDDLTTADASYTTASKYIQQINQQLETGYNNLQSLKGESQDVLLGGLSDQDASNAIGSSYVQLVKVRFSNLFL